MARVGLRGVAEWWRPVPLLQLCGHDTPEQYADAGSAVQCHLPRCQQAVEPLTAEAAADAVDKAAAASTVGACQETAAPGQLAVVLQLGSTCHSCCLHVQC